VKISDNTIQAVSQYFKEELNNIFTAPELEQMLYITLFHYFGLSRIDISINKNKRLSESDLLKVIYTIKGLKKKKPLAYILGEWEFYGISLKVNEHTLIPRPETEELVELIIKTNKHHSKLDILDIGTGSGCIALALKKHLPIAKVSAWEISEEALSIASENAKLNKLKLAIKKIDILGYKNYDIADKYDVIVSNPPYIIHEEKKIMQKNVLNYEPHLALFVEDSNPLLFYDVISDFALSNLKEQGKLYFELNEKYGVELKKLLKHKKFKNVNIVKDINEKDRIVCCNI
jgi:release factor glutamine methyltransferase